METVDRELQEEVLVEMSDCGANAMRALVNKNWTQILNFFTAKIGFLCNAMYVLIHPCLVGWSVSGIP